MWSAIYLNIIYFRRAKSRDFLRFRAPAFVYKYAQTPPPCAVLSCRCSVFPSSWISFHSATISWNIGYYSFWCPVGRIFMIVPHLIYCPVIARWRVVLTVTAAFPLAFSGSSQGIRLFVLCTWVTSSCKKQGCRPCRVFGECPVFPACCGKNLCLIRGEWLMSLYPEALFLQKHYVQNNVKKPHIIAELVGRR